MNVAMAQPKLPAQLCGLLSLTSCRFGEMKAKGCEMLGRSKHLQALSASLCAGLSQPLTAALLQGEYELHSTSWPFLWVCVTSSSHGPQHC